MNALICGGDEPVPEACPKDPSLQHTPAPTGYVDWFEWASRMFAKRKSQRKCPGCGLYKVWR